MKPGPLLLLNIVLIAVGIFIYDSMRDDKPKHVNEPTNYDLVPGDLDEPDDNNGGSEPMLYGGGNETLAQANSVRLGRLENLIKALRGRAPGSGGSDGNGSGTDSPLASSGGPIPDVGPGDTIDDQDPYFDETRLKALQAYMDEINRRKAEERQRSRIEAELKRQGLDLNESQHDSVIAETLKYQAKSRDLMRSGFARDEAGREARREAFKGLQEEYATVIKRLVPAEDAEKIMNSRISRGMGFFSGASFPNRSGGRRNR